ncbi:hypothetical protein F4808DRAFT_445296 [Astrocystis sublimbata]|nr:hypothetical protein F4808DRAFT_445296 [Astrocystis sublimbata]
MNDNDSILSWIHNLPQYTAPPPKGRGRPAKRKRDADLDAGLDETTSSLPGVDRLSVETDVEINALEPRALPAAARKLVTTIEEIGYGHDILPHDWKSTIVEAVKAQDPDNCRLWRHSFQPPDTTDRLPGRIPTYDEVVMIHRTATECQQYRRDMSSWNLRVHWWLLEIIFKDAYRRQCNNFNALSCTTPHLHLVFKPVLKYIKTGYLQIYASIVHDADLSVRIANLSRLTSKSTEYYIDFSSIGTRPLLLNIETKEPDGSLEAAQLQIGDRLANEWAVLKSTIKQRLWRRCVENGLEDLDPRAIEAETLTVLSTLEFIPGVVVQGHRWYLVLSTYENGKTKLLADRQFGTTQTELGIYSTIAGIRELIAWARDEYFPWHVSNVL